MPCFHSNTKGRALVLEAELCWNEDRVATPEVKEDFPVCTSTGSLLGVKNGGVASP